MARTRTGPTETRATPIPTRKTARTAAAYDADVALARCAGDTRIFLERYWGRAPLMRSAHEGEVSFDDLASFEDIDHMISSRGLTDAYLRMVKDGDALAPDAYTTDGGKRGAARHVSPALVYKRFGEGATVVLESLHRYWPPLTDFCRALELALGHRLQVNAYVTPPGSQGFDVHRDEHDVFVLQVSGHKHWIVYDRDDEDRVLIDEELRPGASLYIPKGFPHAAHTADSASAHLTVGILTHEAHEIVRALAAQAGQDEHFRERLSASDVGDLNALKAAVERYLEEFRRWVEKVDVDDLTHRVARRVMSTAQPILRGQLRQLELVESIDERTVVRRRVGATCHMYGSGANVHVLLSDRELQFPSAADAALEFVIARESFTVAGLHAYLDPPGALVLVRRLVREGFLEVLVEQ